MDAVDDLTAQRPFGFVPIELAGEKPRQNLIEQNAPTPTAA
jgi:hypothetical protein